VPRSRRETPLILDETDDRFEVRESTISGAGRGVFAIKPLDTGDRLAVVGVLISRDSVADECTRYADEHKFRVGGYLLIPVGFAGMANHSVTAPNMEKVLEGNEVYLVATRPVQVGEELLWTYSPYAQERFGLAAD
jgi:hypothetical protein